MTVGQPIDLSRGVADVGWGEVSVGPLDGLRVDALDGASIHVGDVESMAIAGDVLAWLDAGGALLVASAKGPAIYRIDSVTYDVELERLDREAARRFRFLQFHPVPDRGLVVLYERGLLLYGVGARPAWHVIHGDLSAMVAGLTSEGVVIESQLPLHAEGFTRMFAWANGEG